jgi:low affinity Fe/Cu permease
MNYYTRFSKAAAHLSGNPQMFALCLTLIILWILTGPIFNFSDTWQLFLNSGTSIITLLMVFLIQNTQNRDTQTIQIKLDELIRATQGANNALLDLEELNDTDLEFFQKKYDALAEEARAKLASGFTDTGTAET